MYLRHLLMVVSGALLLAFTSAASPLIGQDYLALSSSHFDANRAARYLTPSTPIGVLDNTFGTDIPKVTNFLIHLNPSLVRVHILNTTCVRNRNCGDNELVYRYTKSTLDAKIRRKDKVFLDVYKRRVQIWKGISGRLPQTSFLISPALEHDLSITSWRVLADATKSVWPEVQLVNSPDGGIKIERYKNAWVERHGSAPQSGADIVSLDGADATDIDMPKFISRVQSSKVTFIWSSSYNCRIQNLWQDPRKRTACPTGQQLELLSHIGEAKGAPPVPSFTCRKLAPFKSPWIWKPFAERSGDKRSLLPVAITGYSKQNLTVINSKGESLGRLSYFGTYNKLFRSYSGHIGGSRLGGYQFEKKALESTGNHYVWIKSSDNRCNGPFVPSRRAGDYR